MRTTCTPWRSPMLRFVTEPVEGGANTEPATGEPTELEKALAELEKWKNLSRQNEQRAKDNAEKAKKFDELEEQSKTELQKAVERAETAEKALAERNAKDEALSLAKQVATEKKLSERNLSADVLRGSTREELEAHADQLLAILPAPTAAADPSGQGATGRIGSGEEMSAEDIVAAVTKR